MKKKKEDCFITEDPGPLLLEKDRSLIEKMKQKTEDFLNYEVKELCAQNQYEAKIYLSLIRNVHSKKIKGENN